MKDEGIFFSFFSPLNEEWRSAARWLIDHVQCCWSLITVWFGFWFLRVSNRKNLCGVKKNSSVVKIKLRSSEFLSFKMRAFDRLRTRKADSMFLSQPAAGFPPVSFHTLLVWRHMSPFFFFDRDLAWGIISDYPNSLQSHFWLLSVTWFSLILLCNQKLFSWSYVQNCPATSSKKNNNTVPFV